MDIRKFMKRHKFIIKLVICSLITSVLLLAIVATIIWHNRAMVFGFFQNKYLQNEIAKTNNKEEDSNQNLTGQETFVVNSVKEANPAVVAITISQNVPKYDISYEQQQNPFGDFFGNNPFFNNMFQVPQYKQNGTEKKEVGSGSGFIVSPDGYIVTNKHVVDQKDAEYSVIINNNDKEYSAKVIAKDSVLDIAIIKIEPGIGADLPYLNLGNSDNLQLGQTVIAIGNALGEFKNSVSVGIVSGLSRSITAGDASGKSEHLSEVIQTDAAINPGNSGGPLLDLRGNVVGVNVAVAQGGQSIGFALPINSVKSVIDSVMKTGKIVRPYLGLRYQPITSELKESNDLKVDYGVIVKSQSTKELAVILGGPADKAGIVENDIILEVDGKKLDNKTDLANLIRSKSVGDTVILKILHRGEDKTVTVKLEQAPEAK